MTEAPPPRGSSGPAVFARAFASGIAVALIVAAVGQAIAAALFLIEGGGYVPYARLGAVYVELFHRVEVSAHIAEAGGRPLLSFDIGIGLLLVLAGAVVLLARAGRAAAASGSGAVAATAALAVGYAVVPFALSFLARGVVDVPVVAASTGPLDVGVPALQAFALPLAIAAAAAATGALSARDREPEEAENASPVENPPRAAIGIADVVAGGVRAFGLGLLLSIVGLLVLGSVRPGFLRGYASVLTVAGTAQGDAILVGHAVLLAPNQALWVLGPAMGACDEVVVDGRATPFLCYDRMPARLPEGLTGEAGSLGVSSAFATPSRWYLAFLLVPLAATVTGGARATRGRSAPLVTRALAGAASGLIFAGLVAASFALARMDIRASGAVLGKGALRIALGPELARGAVLAAAWGVAGGALGAALSGHAGGRGTRAE